jgi:hypothetical protein
MEIAGIKNEAQVYGRRNVGDNPDTDFSAVLLSERTLRGLERLEGEELFHALEDLGVIKIGATRGKEQFSDRLMYSLWTNLSDPAFKAAVLKGAAQGLSYRFEVRPDDEMPESDTRVERRAGNVIAFEYSEDLVHMNFARLNEFRDGMNQRDYRTKLIRDQFLEDAMPRPLDMDSPAIQAVIAGQADLTAQELVDKLEALGVISFSGKFAGEVEKGFVSNLKDSAFFRDAFIDHLKEGRSVIFVSTDTGGSVLGNHTEQDGADVIQIDTTYFEEDKYPYDRFRETVAHEFFHARGLGHNADMELALAQFFHEAGLEYDGPAIIGDKFDYDNFWAAVEAFREANVFDSEMDDQTARGWLDTIFGPNHGLSVHEALSIASQKGYRPLRSAIEDLIPETEKRRGGG